MHGCSKTWGHEQGLSCAFRQWRADSHCKQLHGYALSVRIDFEAITLNEQGWVIDFGGLKTLKQELVDLFDHKTLVARDDPALEWFKDGHAAGTLDLVIVDRVGCEAFAQLVAEYAGDFICGIGERNRVRVARVTISEHGANSASYIP